ncbi:MAG TPA: flagellar hook-basal body complex protein [Planctomycetota bacterium]|nr:flagellar hook-basal body complex protein [Planctomycetota bacterium]
MASSLFTALSGLKTHENWISIIGNNLANANTTGFKSSRAVFSDQFSQTLRFASLPSGSLGGRNPMQVGLGVQLADIGRDFSQGALATTGRTFDLALNGNGHFMLTDGITPYYSRVGTFGLDATSRLVDQRTGFRVLNRGGAPIQLDTTSLFPPSATTTVSFKGNLPAEVSGPLAQVLTSSSGFSAGTPATLLGNSSTPDAFVVPVGETYTMEISVNGGAPITVSLPGQVAPYTAADVANLINAIPNSGLVASAAAGQVQLETAATGTATSIRITAGPSATDAAGLLGLSTNLVSGSQTTAQATTDLNLLPINQTDYQVGDVIEVSGLDHGGVPVQASFTYGVDGTTLGDLTAFVDSAFANANADFDPLTGQISLTADETGSSGLSLAITDLSGTGQSNWAQHAFVTTTTGTGPDTAATSIEVFDQSGTSHTVNFDYERQDDGSWTITASASDGVASGVVTGLRFNQNGSIASVPPQSSFQIQFPNQSPQTLTLTFGTPGQYDGVTQFGQAGSVFADSQDGYGVGNLSNISVNQSGEIQGFYTNGQIQELGDLGIATFVNDNGLREVGDNLWTESPNSGTRTVGAGSQGRAGAVVAGALEASNVEVAEEFVRLIEAQRGFQANARVITTTDEVLAELVNLI